MPTSLSVRMARAMKTASRPIEKMVIGRNTVMMSMTYKPKDERMFMSVEPNSIIRPERRTLQIPGHPWDHMCQCSYHPSGRRLMADEYNRTMSVLDIGGYSHSWWRVHLKHSQVIPWC